MRACTYFLLLFAYTDTSILNTPKEDNANLALKVVVEININGNSKKVFDATNETVIDENQIRRTDFRAPTVETFTGFIQRVANILNTYEDTAVKHFFDILNKELRKYHYKGCKFHELTENHEFRSIMAENLDLIKGKSVPVLKAEVNKLLDIRPEIYDKNVKEFLDYINSLYRGGGQKKFGKVLSELKAYGNSTTKRSKKNLVKIIREGVRAIVFNHYTDLNINVRRELKKEIAKFLKTVKEALSVSPRTDLFPYNPAIRKFENTVKIQENNISIKDKNSKHRPEIYTISTVNNNNILNHDENHQQEAMKLKTPTEENISQQLLITYLSTDESSDETIEGHSAELSQERRQEFNPQAYATLNTLEISDKITAEPEIIYNSFMKSNLVQRMLLEKSKSRQTTVQPTTTPGLRLLSDEDLRRSILPPLPEEELSIDVFDREERQRQKSLAKRNRTASLQHGIKKYIKRIRNLKKEIKELKKIDDYNRKSKINVISNGDKIKTKQNKKTRKNKKAKDKKHKGTENKMTEKIKHVSVRQSDEYKARAQTEKRHNKARESKRDVKITNSVNENVQDLESNKETVKNDGSHAYKLNKQKKFSRNKSTNDAMTLVKIRVRRALKPFATSKNNAGNAKVNHNHLELTKTTFRMTKKVGKATLNVNEEGKQKRIRKRSNDNYVTRDNPTRRYRRVLEFSSPPHYDDPFFDYHTFR